MCGFGRVGWWAGCSVVFFFFFFRQSLLTARRSHHWSSYLRTLKLHLETAVPRSKRMRTEHRSWEPPSDGLSRMMRAMVAGPGHAPQSTNDDRDEGDQIACARHRRGRGQDRRYRRSRRSSSISAGRWSREVPPPRSCGSSYFGRPPTLDVERHPDPQVPGQR